MKDWAVIVDFLKLLAEAPELVLLSITPIPKNLVLVLSCLNGRLRLDPEDFGLGQFRLGVGDVLFEPVAPGFERNLFLPDPSEGAQLVLPVVQ